MVDNTEPAGDTTLNYWLPIWLRNMVSALGRNHLDVNLYRPPREVKRYVFLGIGPSAKLYVPSKDDLVIGNQSSFLANPDLIDVIVINDAGIAVLTKLHHGCIKTLRQPSLFAATHSHKGVWSLPLDIYTFHNVILSKIPFVTMVYDALCPLGVSTHIVQAGNSLNAALLLFAHLSSERVHALPKLPLHLAGIDFAYEDGSADFAFKDYARSNQKIMAVLYQEGFEATMEKTPGPLKQWIKEV